ncbi:MAG: hypothetical protein HY352_03640 [Candidatus Omnitrophica bacterium]|nr:hypothetical protein [Candidatus Omnitrophota bacterium]
MTAPKRPYRRRQFIVNRPLQFRFVSIMLAMFAALTVLMLGGMYFALWMTLYTFDLLRDPVMVSLFTTTELILALEFVLLIPLVIWIGIWLTHKVAGPLVRIRAALAMLAEGRFNVQVTLRKGDALIELAEDVNRLAGALRRRG